ncbi:MAG: flavoprotein [Promethearchaeota archaeon]
MSLIPQISSFLSDQTSPSIIWCYTGAGHYFNEIYDEIIRVNEESIPVCFVFSDAGALVANRYGLFWRITHSDYRKEYTYFIFEDVVAGYNIPDILDEANFSYSILSKDPSYSTAIALANSEVECIIACPLTANTASKLALGVTDSIISNLLSAGLKSGKRIGVLPTDAIQQRIQTRLPIRQIKPTSTKHVNSSICKFNALVETSTNKIEFHSQFCVGCRKCVEKFPDVFSYGDEIEIKIRKIDALNIQKLSAELTVFNSPNEILPFIRRLKKS